MTFKDVFAFVNENPVCNIATMDGDGGMCFLAVIPAPDYDLRGQAPAGIQGSCS